MSKYRATITIEMDVTVDEADYDEMETEIFGGAESAASALAETLKLADIHVGRPSAAAVVKPVSSKRTSKRRR